MTTAVHDARVDLAESYRACTLVARSEARNFYFSFLALPAERRRAMCAIYAFMRYSDDISDDEGGDVPRAVRMRRWRGALDAALEGEYGGSEILPAFHDTVRQYGIPRRYFHELIDGAEMDLEPRVYETFDDLYGYCYHVASVVGLVCIHIFGFSDPKAPAHAEACGIAFQLTNILRDLREDAARGRIYVPREDLQRFGYSEADLRAGVVNEPFLALMRFEVDRALGFYSRAQPLVGMIDPVCRPCLRAMMQIYGGILDQIVSQRYDVFSSRAQVPAWGKLGIAARAWLQARLESRRGP